MNKAIQGNTQEVIYTKTLNQKRKFWNTLEYNPTSTYAIHVKSYKFGKINNAKIPAKADIYFAKGIVPEKYLIENDYYLDEDDVSRFNLKPIVYSGLSIKLPGSNYTITKISPVTFKKIFKSNVLGAGASIYSTKNFHLNKRVLSGWGVESNYFVDFFKKELSLNQLDLEDAKTLSIIKTHSNKKISTIILGDTGISDLIFKGIGNFDEPYTAHWIIEDDILKPNYYIPFNITTGSGRSKGVYTVVLKPI